MNQTATWLFDLVDQRWPDDRSQEQQLAGRLGRASVAAIYDVSGGLIVKAWFVQGEPSFGDDNTPA